MALLDIFNDPVFRSIMSDAGPVVDAEGNPVHSPRTIRVDVLEEKDIYKVLADIPGVSKDRIKVNVTGDILRLTVGGKVYSDRPIRMPRSDALSDIKAKNTDGVLEICVSKTAEAKARDVAIE